MSNSQNIPTFNMKVVVRETGIKPDTLRAWERRYGIPDPERTKGGHRLYSQYEIDMLKWLVERQDEGMSISHAVELWQQIESTGQDPLQTYSNGQEASPPPPAAALEGGEVIGALRRAWIQACLDFNEREAQNILSQAFARFPTEVVCTQVMQRGLMRIGQGWYEGTISVQQEHFATELAIRQLEALIVSTAPPVQNVHILVACPPYEQHTFSPLLLTLLFRRRGWHVIYLGANVPADQLASMVDMVSLDMVILSAQTLYAASTLLEMANLLLETKIPLAFGGAVFNFLPGLARRIPGHFLGMELQGVPERVQHLLQMQPPTPSVTPRSPEYDQALAAFVELRPSIEARVQSLMQEVSSNTRDLSQANEDIGNHIKAALTLGDIDFITADINWIQGFLINHDTAVPKEVMQSFIRIYYQAAYEVLGAYGQPLFNWFDKLLRSLSQIEIARDITK